MQYLRAGFDGGLAQQRFQRRAVAQQGRIDAGQIGQQMGAQRQVRAGAVTCGCRRWSRRHSCRRRCRCANSSCCSPLPLPATLNMRTQLAAVTEKVTISA